MTLSETSQLQRTAYELMGRNVQSRELLGKTQLCASETGSAGPPTLALRCRGSTDGVPPPPTPPLSTHSGYPGSLRSCPHALASQRLQPAPFSPASPLQASPALSQSDFVKRTPDLATPSMPPPALPAGSQLLPPATGPLHVQPIPVHPPELSLFLWEAPGWSAPRSSKYVSLAEPPTAILIGSFQRNVQEPRRHSWGGSRGLTVAVEGEVPPLFWVLAEKG